MVAWYVNDPTNRQIDLVISITHEEVFHSTFGHPSVFVTKIVLLPMFGKIRGRKIVTYESPPYKEIEDWSDDKLMILSRCKNAV